jgi:hypothetical protein
MSELRKVEGMARRMVENLKSELQPTLLSLNSSFTSKLIELDNTFSGIAQQINNLALQDGILSNNLGKERDKFTEDTLAYRIAKRDFTGTTTQDSIDTSLTSVLAVNVDTDMTIDALQNLIFTYDATVYFYAQVKTYDKDTGLLGFQITKAAGTPGIYSPWTIKLGDRQISDSFGTTANTVCEGNDPRLSNARTPTAHTHILSDITQSGAATNEVPAWNGSNWVPATRASLSSANTFTALQTFTSGLEANKLTLGTSTLNSSVAGCVEYDGKVAYANTVSGRGLMVTEQTSLLISARTINNATGNQNIFGTPQDVITLAANTTYMIRGYLFLSMGTTTARHLALRFTESLSANPPTIHFSTIGMPSTNGAPLRTQDMAWFTIPSGGNITNATFTSATYNAWITGMITTVDSVTITPQIAFSAAPGNTCSVNMGTFISFIPYGSNTMAAVGPWS